MQRREGPRAEQARPRPRRRWALLLALAALALAPAARAQELRIPPPRGYVNDFAGIIDPQSEAAITRVIEEVRAKSAGEIAVVTLPSLQGRSRDEVALQILREWGIGRRQQGVGDSTANLGALILVAVQERDIRIELGRGTNTFITAAEAGRIRDEQMVPAFRRSEFGPGILAGTQALAGHYAQRFNFRITGAVPAQPERQTRPVRTTGGISPGFVIFLLIFFFLMLRGRGGGGGGGFRGRRRRRGMGMPIILPFPVGGGWGGGGFGGGGWGGGGFGGGGGGFGGFGGGDGGGGGAGGDW